MMNVDAPTLTLSRGSVVYQPDFAEITLSFRTESTKPDETIDEHERLHSSLEQLLAKHGASILPVSHASERKKLLKKGVFGHGQHSVLRTHLVVQLPLDAAWSFWDRVRRAQALRTALNTVSDKNDDLQVSLIQWTLRDRRPGELKAYAALAESIRSQANALGADVVELKPAVCSVTIEGPARAVFCATAELSLRLRAVVQD